MQCASNVNEEDFSLSLLSADKASSSSDSCSKATSLGGGGGGAGGSNRVVTSATTMSGHRLRKLRNVPAQEAKKHGDEITQV